MGVDTSTSVGFTGMACTLEIPLKIQFKFYRLSSTSCVCRSSVRGGRRVRVLLRGGALPGAGRAPRARAAARARGD